MKRLVIMLVWVLILGQITSASSAPLEPTEDNIRSICYDGSNTIYYAKRNNIYQYPNRLIASVDHPIQLIRADAERIYIIVGVEDKGEILVFDLKTMSITKKLTCGYVEDFDIRYPIVYTCEFSNEFGYFELIARNILDNTNYTFDSVYDPHSISLVKDELIILSSIAPGAYSIISSHNIQTANVSILAEMPPFGMIQFSHREPNSYLLHSNNGVYYLLPNDEGNALSRLNIKLDDQSNVCSDGSNLYFSLDDKINIISMEEALGESSSEDMIIGGDSVTARLDNLAAALQIFKEKNPEVNTTIRAYVSNEKLFDSLLNEDTCPDILIMSNFNYHRFWASSVLDNLLNYEPIISMKNAGDYSEWIFSIISSAPGTCYMLPFGYFLPSFMWAESAHARIFTESQNNKSISWSDFFSIVEQNEMHIHLPNNYMFLSSAINLYYQAENNSISFDFPEFRRLCESWKKHMQYDEYSADYHNEQDLDHHHNESSISQQHNSLNEDEHDSITFSITGQTWADLSIPNSMRMVIPSIIENGRSLGSESLLISIPKNAKLKNFAADFIREYYSYIGSNNHNSSYDNLLVSKKKLEAYKSLYTSGDEANWIDYESILTLTELRDPAPRLQNELHELINLYFIDKYTIDELILEMNRTANEYFASTYGIF